MFAVVVDFTGVTNTQHVNAEWSLTMPSIFCVAIFRVLAIYPAGGGEDSITMIWDAGHLA